MNINYIKYGLIALIAALCYFPFAILGFMNFDQGGVYTISRMILDGQMPIRDFPFPYFILSVYTHAFLSWLFPWVNPHIISTVWTFITYFVVALVGLYFVKRLLYKFKVPNVTLQSSLIWISIFFLFGPVIEPYLKYNTDGLRFATAGFLLLAIAFFSDKRKSGSYRFILAGSLCIGLAGISVQHIGVGSIAIGCLLLFAYWLLSGNLTLKSFMKLFLVPGIIIFLPIGLMIGFFIWKGAYHDFYYWTVVMPAKAKDITQISMLKNLIELKYASDLSPFFPLLAFIAFETGLRRGYISPRSLVVFVGKYGIILPLLLTIFWISRLITGSLQMQLFWKFEWAIVVMLALLWIWWFSHDISNLPKHLAGSLITGTMIIGLPFLINHHSVNPVFFNRYSYKAIIIIAMYLFVLLLVLLGAIFMSKGRDFISKILVKVHDFVSKRYKWKYKVGTWGLGMVTVIFISLSIYILFYHNPDWLTILNTGYHDEAFKQFIMRRISFMFFFIITGVCWFFAAYSVGVIWCKSGRRLALSFAILFMALFGIYSCALSGGLFTPRLFEMALPLSLIMLILYSVYRAGILPSYPVPRILRISIISSFIILLLAFQLRADWRNADPLYRPVCYAKPLATFVDCELVSELDIARSFSDWNPRSVFVYQADPMYYNYLDKLPPGVSIYHDEQIGVRITPGWDQLELDKLQSGNVSTVITFAVHKRIDSFRFRKVDPIRDWIESEFKPVFTGKFIVVWKRKNYVGAG